LAPNLTACSISAVDQATASVVLQIIGLRKCSALDGDCLHALSFSQTATEFGLQDTGRRYGVRRAVDFARAHSVPTPDLHHVQKVETSLCSQVWKDQPCEWALAITRDISEEEYKSRSWASALIKRRQQPLRWPLTQTARGAASSQKAGYEVLYALLPNVTSRFWRDSPGHSRSPDKRALHTLGAK
jgi:hypothetical protein